jgi:hypothetical protein
MVRLVLVGDPRAARCRQPVPGDLGRPAAAPGGDHEFLANDAAPDPGPCAAGWGGVADRPEPGGLVVADQPLLAQREGIGLVRQRVQPLPLRGQPDGQLGGGLAGTRSLTARRESLI